jgi:hypothetical protein
MALFGKKDKPAPASPQDLQIREQQEVNTAYQKGITALRDFIAPSSLEFKGKAGCVTLENKRPL